MKKVCKEALTPNYQETPISHEVTKDAKEIQNHAQNAPKNSPKNQLHQETVPGVCGVCQPESVLDLAQNCPESSDNSHTAEIAKPKLQACIRIGINKPSGLSRPS